MTMTLSGDGTIGGLAAGGLPDNTIATNDIVDAAVTPAKISQKPTLGTAVASTSGTSIDFTGIPSWVKRITVMFSGVSGSGTSNFLVQIGSGSITSSGYSSGSSRFLSASGAVATSTTGFLVTTTLVATDVTHGTCQICNLSGNTWIATSVVGNVGLNGSQSGGGNVTLSGTLDRIRITTVNGTDTFDAGSINILYE